MGYNPFAHYNINLQILIFYVFLVLTDILVTLLIVKMVKSKVKKKTAKIFNFILSGLMLISFFIYLNSNFIPCKEYQKIRIYYVFIGLFMLFYLPKIISSVFIIAGFLIQISSSLMQVLFRRNKTAWLIKLESAFFSLAVFCGVLVFIVLLHGMVVNRHNYVVKTKEIYLDRLPPAFEGYRIVQLSDIHLGSMFGKKAVEKLIRKVNGIRPDLLIFNGDMVNVVSEEALPYLNTFRELSPSFPKISVFGNHDYGDYAWCLTEAEQRQEKELLKTYEEQMGFRVLQNEAVMLIKGKDTKALIGLENWGPPPYKKYGDLDKALKGVEKIKPKILLSHDPEHWTREVIPSYDIELTLSGHTHAMQLGFRLGNITWSPARYRYWNYNGLYERNGKQQYVSRGVGYLGFPGRIGLRPEITLLILKSK